MCCFPWLAATCMGLSYLTVPVKLRCQLARFQSSRAVRILPLHGDDSYDEHCEPVASVTVQPPRMAVAGTGCRHRMSVGVPVAHTSLTN